MYRGTAVKKDATLPISSTLKAMANAWLRDAPYTLAMFSDPFAYRARLTDADLDFYDGRSRLINMTSVRQGLITQEEADRRREMRQADRERKKEEDRYLELHVDVEWDTSDDSFGEDTPLSPPRSPDRQTRGLDLSTKAWKKECSLIRLRGRFDLRELGFDDYETWKQYQIKHSQPQSATQPPHNRPQHQPPPSSPPSSPPSHPPPILRTRSRQIARASRKGYKQ